MILICTGMNSHLTNSLPAVNFLLSHKFRMEAPFVDGVSYLSREEEITARRIALQKREKHAIIDIQLRADDEESLKFLQRVRDEVDAWIKQKVSRFVKNMRILCGSQRQLTRWFHT